MEEVVLLFRFCHTAHRSSTSARGRKLFQFYLSFHCHTAQRSSTIAVRGSYCIFPYPFVTQHQGHLQVPGGGNAFNFTYPFIVPLHQGHLQVPEGGSDFIFTYPFIVSQHQGHLQLQLEEVIAFILSLSHSTKVSYKCQGEEVVSIVLILSLSHSTKVIYNCS